VLEFFFFVLILCGAFWGSSFVYLALQRASRRVEGPGEGPADALLREEVENLAGRLARVEDEFEFYKQLRAPDEPET
jgi:hypothetical protein